MCEVLRNDLEWEEESWDFSHLFVGNQVIDCEVYQDEDASADILQVAMTLADGEIVTLRAYSFNEIEGHYIIHAFLSDPNTGCVVKDFPLHRTILGVTRVRREELDRSWSCCGHSMNDGCFVSGLKFTFAMDSNEPSRSNVILHCWDQCKPIPFCGDPHSPKYTFFNVTTHPNLMGKKSSFLPPDFLAHLGCSGGFCPIDASGMMIAGTARGRSLRYDQNIFSAVKKQLGVGEWSLGPFWQFRKTYAEERLIQLLLPKKNAGIGIGPLFGVGMREQVKWQEILHEISEKEGQNCTILYGSYENIQDVLHLPPSRITSTELNAAVKMAKSPTFIFPASKSQEILEKVSLALSSEKESISVRFTDGNSLEFLGGRFAPQTSKNFKSRVQHGCPGGSLGFHLVESNDMRKVITLHGSVEELMYDLEQSCAGVELEMCKGLICDGNAAAVLRMRCSPGGYSSRDQEVMSMRISNPSAHALMACGLIMPDGRVQYDSRTKALYPITYDGGNVRREAACALILEILKTMKNLKASKGMQDLMPSVISVSEIY